MHLHEHQSKHLFSQYGIPVPAGRVVDNAEAARNAAQELGGGRWVVKAQIHSGARGKAGGVRVVDSADAAAEAAKAMLGTRLVTTQTGPKGLPVERVLVEVATDVARELYLGLLVDRRRERLALIAAGAGGMDIETLAAEKPEAILREALDPVAGLQPYQCRKLAFALELTGDQIKALQAIVQGVCQLASERDANLIEINPLVVTHAGKLLALDAKLDIDDNALYRQTTLAQWRDENQEDDTERAARAHGLNYVTLDGNIACMVNGAGLAMATMDLIKLHGAEPANFLDVGGTATAEKVAEAFKLILADAKVKAILVNIFGGIVRCDLIAEGIIRAVQEVGVKLPVVVRLEGTNVEKGRALLAESGLNVVTAEGLTDAAKKVVLAARGVAV